MSENDEIAIVVLILVALLIFFAGVAVGNQATSKDIKENICKQLNVETTSYFECKQKQLDEIMKEIK